VRVLHPGSSSSDLAVLGAWHVHAPGEDPTSNPTNPGTTSKVPASAMVTLTAKQGRELLKQAEGWLHTLVMLGAATGARRGELLALRWSEVNLDAGTVRIARSVVLVGGELHGKAPKSETGTRTIVLGRRSSPSCAATAPSNSSGG
jgi:integrase